MQSGGRLVSDRAVVLTAMLGGVLALLNSTMIVVALPEILQDLGASLTWGTWIILSYLVAMAAVQPLGGSLGDRFGRRRLFLLGLGGFLVASVGRRGARPVAWRDHHRGVRVALNLRGEPRRHRTGTCMLKTLHRNSPAAEGGDTFADVMDHALSM